MLKYCSQIKVTSLTLCTCELITVFYFPISQKLNQHSQKTQSYDFSLIKRRKGIILIFFTTRILKVNITVKQLLNEWFSAKKQEHEHYQLRDQASRERMRDQAE